MKSKNSKLIVQNSIPNFLSRLLGLKKKMKNMYISMKIIKKITHWNFFGVEKFFFVNFDFKNKFKNEFEDNNEKSCSRFKNRVPLKIDLRADWTYESNSTAWELNRYEPEINDLCYINVNRKLWFPPENS